MASQARVAPLLKASASASNSSMPTASSPAPGNRQRGTPNGIGNKPKAQLDAKPATPAPKESQTPEKHAHDRLLFLLANAVGCQANVSTKASDHFSGIFSSASLETDSKFVLKMTKRAAAPVDQQTNGEVDCSDDYVGSGSEHVMIFDFKDVDSLTVTDVSTERALPRALNGTAAKFRTDVETSGNLALRERELQAWEPTEESGIDLALNGSGKAGWDQFAANEQLYNVKSSYDENLYTTTIDRSHPTYKQRYADADRIAREIEGSATTNAHIAEERGLEEGNDDVDEESKYSGVKRDFPPLASSQPNKYTPPARRAAGVSNTHPAPPVDNAIISTQRPEPAKPKANTKPTSSTKKEGVLSSVHESSSTPSATGSGKDIVPLSTESGDEKAILTETKESKEASTSQRPLPNPALPALPQNKPAGPALASNGIEAQLHDAFRQFANDQRMKVTDKKRASAAKEREAKMNDLKLFASSFKLKTEVPKDMLGILAKEKSKQKEIMEKSQRDIKDQQQKQVSDPSISAVAAEPNKAALQPSQTSTTRADLPNATVSERPSNKNNRLSQGPPGPQGSRSATQAPHATVISPRVGSGNLSQRLMANPQYRAGVPSFPTYVPGPDQRFPPTAPAALNTDTTASRSGGISTPTSSVSSRLNVSAMEFKPNPNAISFQPAGDRSSPANARKQTRPVDRVSFFEGKRPAPPERKTLKDSFNPVIRLKKDTDEKKAKEYAANGAIPQAYRTLPTWEVTEENRDKSYKDMFEQPHANMPSSASTPLPHQHQLPPYLQQSTPQGMPQVHVQHQQPPMHPQQMHGQGPDNHYRDYPMQHSASSTGVHPSPRFQTQMLYPGQMHTQMQPGFSAPYTIGPNGQPMVPVRHFPGGHFQPQSGHMSPAMMIQQQGAAGGSFMGVQAQTQVPIYASPGQASVIPAHLGGPQTPGAPNNYPSPRPAAPIMMHQGSQQGHHQQQQFMYMAQGQPGTPMFATQQPAQIMHMRGGMPMQQQHSYSGSPHLQHHFPAQHRGSTGSGVPPNFGHFASPQPQLHPNQQMMHQQGQPPAGPMAHAVAEHDEVK